MGSDGLDARQHWGKGGGGEDKVPVICGSKTMRTAANHMVRQPVPPEILRYLSHGVGTGTELPLAALPTSV